MRYHRGSALYVSGFMFYVFEYVIFPVKRNSANLPIHSLSEEIKKSRALEVIEYE